MSAYVRLWMYELGNMEFPCHSNRVILEYTCSVELDATPPPHTHLWWCTHCKCSHCYLSSYLAGDWCHVPVNFVTISP